MMRGGAVYECTFVKVGMLSSPNSPNLASSEVWVVIGCQWLGRSGSLTASVCHHDAFKNRNPAPLPELHQTGLQAESVN